MIAGLRTSLAARIVATLVGFTFLAGPAQNHFGSAASPPLQSQA